MADKPSVQERVEAALRAAEKPMSADEICRAVFGRAGEHERNHIRVVLFRLDAKGILVKYPQSYAIKEST